MGVAEVKFGQLEEEMAIELVILRGLPGSGKSTLAKTEYPDHVLVEADQFFVDPKTGEYHWRESLVSYAHTWCQTQVNRELMQGHNVVVANTFVRREDTKVYMEIAAANGASVVVRDCVGDYGSIHGVPDAAIERMRSVVTPRLLL